MPLLVNLRHLEANNVSLEGQLDPEELDLDPRDELIHVEGPVEYRLEVQQVEDGLLVQGQVRIELECQCARCLKPFRFELELKDWARHLPLQGEEAVPVVSDCVDLTPYIREDILLEFPQHPLCEPECRGLPKSSIGKAKHTSSAGPANAGLSAWDELNKLKF